ncbi:cytochrome c3 family protein [Planctomycetes bacterium K23_9]|uniref:nitrite reductase (cytochrome; ammonia-forming) n=1 Tax=Stieleria marina TaxID=1930275 RepID=A0A517P2W7_9BACT|nr:hypothetical protein K239x_57360 [Planctomycetes bacterium K23_9]
MDQSNSELRTAKWLLWASINLLIVGYFAYAITAPASIVKRPLLPGKTTHGHYQIELDCDACHAPVANEKTHSKSNVMQDACNRCHADQLSLAKDTHPAAKFNDPTNADRLLILDAQNCLSCHQEHVPDQTGQSGLTVPTDYCWHCHQDVADSRPSHVGMAFDSCATAGCHNYHDNRALYEKFLDQHHGEPDYLSIAALPKRNSFDKWSAEHADSVSLVASQSDAPLVAKGDARIPPLWQQSAHAAAGVNCRGCHGEMNENQVDEWTNSVAIDACGECHQRQTESFVRGKHGMRLASGLSPMTPAQARLPMHSDAAHRELTCAACHDDHEFDTQYASVGACQKCHADAHSMAYENSSHAVLWQQELAGELPAGSGVTCATCHMPRMTEGDEVWVSHDQNANLRPSETMAREICAHCHGLEFSLSSLSDPALAENCYSSEPATRIESVQMAHDWFVQRAEAKAQRAAEKARRSTKTKD